MNKKKKQLKGHFTLQETIVFIIKKVVSSHVRNLHCFSHGKLSLLRQFPLM